MTEIVYCYCFIISYSACFNMMSYRTTYSAFMSVSSTCINLFTFLTATIGRPHPPTHLWYHSSQPMAYLNIDIYRQNIFHLQLDAALPSRPAANSIHLLRLQTQRLRSVTSAYDSIEPRPPIEAGTSKDCDCTSRRIRLTDEKRGRLVRNESSDKLPSNTILKEIYWSVRCCGLSVSPPQLSKQTNHWQGGGGGGGGGGGCPLVLLENAIVSRCSHFVA